jgi:hypothetical protein
MPNIKTRPRSLHFLTPCSDPFAHSHLGGASLLGPWRGWPQITDEATTTNSKPEEGIFQGDQRGDSEKAQSRDRAISHVPADFRSNVAAGLNELPNQQDISHVNEEKDGRVERDRLRRKSAYRHPRGRQGKQRNGKEMGEIEPHQPRCGFRGIAQ